MNNNIRNGLATHGLEILKQCVLMVLYEARDGYPIPQETIRSRLDMPKVEELPARSNSLIYGILAHLRDEGYVEHELQIGWKITQEGISFIEDRS